MIQTTIDNIKLSVDYEYDDGEIVVLSVKTIDSDIDIYGLMKNSEINIIIEKCWEDYENR